MVCPMNPLSETSTITRAVEAFTNVFDKALDLWVFDSHRWHHAVEAVQKELPAELLEFACILPESLPKLLDHLPATQIEECAPGIFRIGTSLVVPPNSTTSESLTAIVFGTVQTTAQALIETSLRLSNEQSRMQCEVHEARLGNVPHLEQISSHYEELTWLRRLGEQVGFRNMANPLMEMGQRVLPDLCNLIRAEGLMIVKSIPADPTVAGARVRIGRVVASVGQNLLNDEDCAKLILSLHATPQFDHPILQNHRESLGRHRDLPEIRSCMVLPVLHQERCFGWLVALNRIPWHPVNDDRVVGLGEDSFGTADASLMGSAAAMLGAQASNAELFHEKESLLIGVVRALISTIDAKDAYTSGHSDRVAIIARCIGDEIKLDPRECERLFMAGLLHDVGKIGIPDEILLKPGKLTDEEFAVIRQHPTIGHRILQDVPQLQSILPGVLHHHESVDGRGYPARLADEQIPLFGRILAVADAYDAMTSSRPYRSAMPKEKAETILTDGAGRQWDARIVEAFFSARPAIEIACRDFFQTSQQLQPESSAEHRPTQREAVSESVSRAVTICGADRLVAEPVF